MTDPSPCCDEFKGTSRRGFMRGSLALGGALHGSPFADAMRGAGEAVDALTSDVERDYRVPLR